MALVSKILCVGCIFADQHNSKPDRGRAAQRENESTWQCRVLKAVQEQQ